VTAQVRTAPATTVPAQAAASARELPFRRWIGLLVVALAIAAVEATGRSPGMEPLALLPMAVLLGAACSGLRGGAFAAGVAGLYLVVYDLSPAGPSTGAPARILLGLAANGTALLVAVALRDAIAVQRRRADDAATDRAALAAFAADLASAQSPDVAAAVVRGIAVLLDADMAVLSVVEPGSGRHVVAASYGVSGSALGVGVAPGAGVLGGAIRRRGLVTGTAGQLAVAAAPIVEAGRVVAALAVGRNDGVAFSADDGAVLVAAAPLVALAMRQTLLDAAAGW
jgi:K+-sensing histidine kinase KdpD